METAASRRFSRRLRLTERAWFHLVLFRRTTAWRSGVRMGGRLYQVTSSTRSGVVSDLLGVPPRSLPSRCVRRVKNRDLRMQQRGMVSSNSKVPTSKCIDSGGESWSGKQQAGSDVLAL